MIRRVGSKQAAKIRIYRKVCKELDEEHDGTCFMTGEPIFYIEHHHLFGRTGDLMTNKKYIVCVKPDHKEWWHSKPFSYHKEQPYWPILLAKLQLLGKTDRMYHKLYLKYSEV